MSKGMIAVVSVIGFLLLVAVALLIAASAQGMNIVEMFRSWVETKPETPPVEDVVEPAKIFLNMLRI